MMLIDHVHATPVLEAAIAAPATAALGVADASLLAEVVARNHSEAEGEQAHGETVVNDSAALLEAVRVELGHGA